MSDAARGGIDILIGLKPVVLTVMRKPLVDGGMGQYVPYGEYVKNKKYKCRISRDLGNLQHPRESSVGLTPASDYYLVAPHGADIRKDDILQEKDGNQWRVGIVEKSKIGKDAFVTKAPLERVK